MIGRWCGGLARCWGMIRSKWFVPVRLIYPLDYLAMILVGVQLNSELTLLKLCWRDYWEWYWEEKRNAVRKPIQETTSAA